MKFDLVRPCKNCPFAARGAIELMPGRVPGIIEALKDDFECFPCHKTTHGKYNDDTGEYEPNDGEQACAGAIAYMLKNHHRMPVLARLAISMEMTTRETIEASYPLLKDPKDIT